MNLPNILTLSRIPLMFVIVSLMECHWPGAASLAFILFIAGAVSDWLDGYIARKRNLPLNLHLHGKIWKLQSLDHYLCYGCHRRGWRLVLLGGAWR